MTGENKLSNLLRNMKPELKPGEFVFISMPFKDFSRLKIDSLLTFKEEEGITVIIDKNTAQKNNLKFNAVWAMITLSVHSDLEAVGFLAHITKKLAEARISVNAVSAYYHDHLFVPSAKKNEALAILEEITKTEMYNSAF